MSDHLVALISFVLAAFASFVTLRWIARRPPPRLVRTNYRGRSVPAIGGIALVVGALIGLLPWLALAVATNRTLFEIVRGGRLWIPIVAGTLIMMLGAAGAWDDLRGDERPRGFAGHIGAARGGALTGGAIKVIVGLIAGLIAGYVLAGPDNGVLTTALLIALSANLLNLLDRAPGRAAKIGAVSLLVVIPFAPPGLLVAMAPVLGAVLSVLPSDLRERSMLGDTGANALGAVAGLGLAVVLSPWEIGRAHV